MNTGHLFPLQAFEAAMRDDPEVRGVLYTGSLGGGTADGFSDLDIELWVTDARASRPYYIDADGIRQRRALLRQMRTRERLHGATVEPYDPARHQALTIPSDPAISSQLADLLMTTLGPYQPR
jgi:hypothetical protein